ncbi:hypothetical protein D3C85_1268980 [compost metagenome]
MAVAAVVGGELVVIGIVDRADDVRVGAIAVVVDALGPAVAIRIEQRAHVGQGVPLGGVLEAEQHLVVADDIGRGRVHLGQREVHVRRVVAESGAQLGRMAARIELVAARVVQWQREAEAAPRLDLARALEHLLGADQVDAPQLIVRTEIAPVGALRTLLPTHA